MHFYSDNKPLLSDQNCPRVLTECQYLKQLRFLYSIVVFPFLKIYKFIRDNFSVKMNSRLRVSFISKRFKFK